MGDLKPTQMGFNQEPCQSYSLADRFTCGKCMGTPEIVSAEGTGPILITLTCCGQKVTKSYEKKELTFNQTVFENDGN